MKKLFPFAITLFSASILMGCQIEITPLTDISVSGPNPGEPTTESGGQAQNEQIGISFSWAAPVERENNEQLFAYELGGYNLEYRKVGSDLFTSVMIEDGSLTSYELTDLEPGQYELRLAAFDTNGLYSQYSESKVFSAI